LPRFFLDIGYRSDRVEDNDGSDYTDVAAAHAEADAALRELIADAFVHGTSLPIFITIRDDAGQDVVSVHLSEVLPPGFPKI
jgi:hypothetical protein